MASTTAAGDGVKLNFSTDWKYAPAPETAKVSIKPSYDLFIDGKFVAPAKEDYFDTINPANEKKVAAVASATPEDVDKAVRAARRAYEKVWSKMPGKERGKYVYRIARLLQERAREFAIIESTDGGEAIVNHPDVDKIAFTGSTEVGKIIQKALAASRKKYTLELGGKAANIIFEDATIDQAVEGIINGIFFNQGHVCCAGSRLFIQESVYETVTEKLKDRTETLIVGDPLDKNTDIGAINSKMQLEKIHEYLQIGQEEGAEPWNTSANIPDQGYFCRPTLFLNCSQSHRIVQEEIFGPVLAVQTFRTVAEAIEKANNTPYGLSGGVWTDKGSKIFKVTSALRAGVIWANTYNKFDPTSPFGGYKESGMGREGGLHGLMPYLNLN